MAITDRLARDLRSGGRPLFAPVGFAILLIVILAFPVLFPHMTYVTHLLILILMWGYVGECWNIAGGFGGVSSFGHGLFFGLGAYTTTVLFMRLRLSPWIGMLASTVVVSMVCTVLIYPTFRYGLKGTYLSLVTIAFATAGQTIFNYWEYVGGAQGLLMPLVGDSLIGLQFTSKLPYYFVILAMSVAVVLIAYLIRHSKMGYYLLAIREDESAAEMMGVPTTRYKFLGILISAILTSFGGTFYAQYLLYIEPSILGVSLSITILLSPWVGGIGTIAGPFVGSFVMNGLREISRIYLGQGGAGLHVLIYAMTLILVITFLPGGIMSLINRFLPGKKG